MNTGQSFLHPTRCDSQAVHIVKTLQRQGFTAYLVGGCVRDLLLGFEPKDFDIATNARPQQVKRCISNAYIIGRRFRLVLVRHGTQQFEVSTFRRTVPPNEQTNYKGMVLDNTFGKPEEDAFRRDFTINALFYDPVKQKIVDYVGGQKDLQRGVVRSIGPAGKRIQEDPVRILRAVRLAHKIGFALDTPLKAAIEKYAGTLATSMLPRRREEVLKFLRLGEPRLAFLRVFDLGVLPYLSPALNKLFLDVDRRRQFLCDLDALSHQDLQTTEELLGVLVLAYLKNVATPPAVAALAATPLEATPLEVGPASDAEVLPSDDGAVCVDNKVSTRRSSKRKKIKKPKPPFYLPKGMKEPSYEAVVAADYENIKLKLKHPSSVHFMRRELDMSNFEMRVVWKYFRLYPQLALQAGGDDGQGKSRMQKPHLDIASGSGDAPTPSSASVSSIASTSSARLSRVFDLTTEQLVQSEAFLFSLKVAAQELQLASEPVLFWHHQWQKAQSLSPQSAR